MGRLLAIAVIFLLGIGVGKATTESESEVQVVTKYKTKTITEVQEKVEPIPQSCFDMADQVPVLMDSVSGVTAGIGDVLLFSHDIERFAQSGDTVKLTGAIAGLRKVKNTIDSSAISAGQAATRIDQLYSRCDVLEVK